MNQSDFDVSRIHKCELVTIDGKVMTQFIARGDRHKMMKHEDGSIDIIKLYEQGKEYKYKDLVTIEEALVVLEKSRNINHKTIARQIRHYLAQQTSS